MNITTWNMQGGNAATEVKWQTGVLNLFNANEKWQPEVICLQEAGNVPDSAVWLFNVPFVAPGGAATNVGVYRWSGTTSRPQYHIIFHNWDTAGHRVNTTIVVRNPNPPLAGDVTLVWPAGGAAYRPSLGLRIGALGVFSFHAISPGGPDAAGMTTAIAAFSGANPWIVGADWNREPGTFAIPVGSVMCPPNTNTYSVKNPVSKYDYCVRSAAPAVTGTVVGLILSDHYPDAFIF